jgi:hypothetical protein
MCVRPLVFLQYSLIRMIPLQHYSLSNIRYRRKIKTMVQMIQTLETCGSLMPSMCIGLLFVTWRESKFSHKPLGRTSIYLWWTLSILWALLIGVLSELGKTGQPVGESWTNCSEYAALITPQQRWSACWGPRLQMLGCLGLYIIPPFYDYCRSISVDAGYYHCCVVGLS